MEVKALTLLEQAYDDYISKKIDADKFCKNISIALGALPFKYPKKFYVHITKNTDIMNFFGMRVLPTLEENNAFCQDFIGDGQTMKFKDMVNRWTKFEKWELELDSILFDRYVINFNPKELVAMTLHEVGHVIYSERPLEVFYRAFLENQTRLKIADKASQKLMYTLYMIPLSLSCMQRSWVNGRNEIKMEIVADKSVVEYGYGNYLADALDKIIRKFGTINKTNAQDYNEINTAMLWCNQNIADVVKRKDNLKDELFYHAIKNKSSYLKYAAIIIMDKIGFNMKEKFTGIVVEATLDLVSSPDVLEKYSTNIDPIKYAKFERAIESVQTAALEFFGKTKLVLPSQYEVDAISVEVDNIQNHNDRIFVLDLIYNLLEKIDNFEEGIQSDPMLVRKWSPKINQMKSELEIYRKATLEKKKFPPKQWGCFVKLPAVAADYEG